VASYVDYWKRYRERNTPSRLFERSDRVLAGARFTVGAWQQFFDSFQGWCEEAVEEGYRPSRAIPDALMFHKAWREAAQCLCKILLDEPLSQLETNEESEMAGPAFFENFNGASADLVATQLTHDTDPAGIIPAKHVMLRVLQGGRVMITLVGLRSLVADLPAGTYRGEIRRRIRGQKVLAVVNVHRRKGENRVIRFRGDVP
jgi:hypothetical protein